MEAASPPSIVVRVRLAHPIGADRVIESAVGGGRHGFVSAAEDESVVQPDILDHVPSCCPGEAGSISEPAAGSDAAED
jgi:hypothetical protein